MSARAFIASAARHWPRGARLIARLVFHPADTAAATDGTVHVNAPFLEGIAARFRHHPEGARLLEERPLLDSRGISPAELARLPAGSLGRALFDFYAGYRPVLDADANRELPPGFSGDAAYVGLRLRQTHDLWHVVTGIDTDLCGEIELQAFTFAQLRTPSSFLLGLVGGLRWSPWHRDLMPRVRRALSRGRRAAPLAPLYWEERFARPLASVRAELRL